MTLELDYVDLLVWIRYEYLMLLTKPCYYLNVHAMPNMPFMEGSLPRHPKVPSPHVISIPLSLANTENPSPAPTLVIDLAFSKVCERMSCEQSKNIVYICRYSP